MNNNIPNLFIVGAPKCGTTSLHYYLSQHPDIFLTEPKEPNYFNTDLERNNRISKKDYYDLYKTAGPYKFRGEATPLYLMSKKAPKKIREECGMVKIIISIRKPSELLFSAYLQNKYNFIEDAPNFETAINEEDVRRATLKETKTGEPVERLIYSNFVCFYDQVKRYIDTFGRENVHIIIFDDLKKATKAEVEKIFDFLKIDHNVNINYSLQNKAKGHKNKQIAEFLGQPPKVISQAAKLFLAPKTRSKLYHFLKNQNTRYEKPEVMDGEIERNLTLKYKPEVERLEEYLEIDLSGWKK